MRNVRGIFVVAAVAVAITLGACRREAEHTPMKLGADVAPQGQIAR